MIGDNAAGHPPVVLYVMAAPRRHRIGLIAPLALLAILGAAAPAAAALSPDQIVLIVNRNVPSGLELAQYYARARKIPDGRIIALNLPFNFKVEETTHTQYEFAVARVVRDFLVKNGLEQTVTCAVTFYGVPLRVRARQNSPAETEELAAIDAELVRVRA